MMRIAAVVLAAGSLMVVGCEEKAAPSAKTAADKAAGAVTDAAKSAGAQVQQGAAAASEKAKEVAAKAGDAAADMAARAKSWLTDTVEKQWPAMKDQLAKLEAGVAGITAADVKAKATDVLNSLKADVPKMEELVGKLKGATGTESGTLLEQGRKMWDSFAARLGELAKMIPAGGAPAAPAPAVPGGK